MPNGDDRPMDTPPPPPSGDGGPRRRRPAAGAPDAGTLTPDPVRKAPAPAGGRRARGRVNRAGAAEVAAAAPAASPPPPVAETVAVPARRARRGNGSAAVADAGTATLPRRGRIRANGGDGAGGDDGGDGGYDGPVADARELRRLLSALRSVRDGDFSVRLADSGDPLLGEIAVTLNDIAARQERFTTEVARVAVTVGREGQYTDRVSLGEVSGGWATTVNAINSLITDMMQPTTEVARVLTAVARGDLSQKMTLEIAGKPVQGEFLRIATTVNTMVDQLSAFASEVTRVAREVGTEGVLGGQAEVPGVAGTWKDLTDSVNFMASNLTGQVRDIARVTTAVANGDLGQKIMVELKGEMLELKNTVNVMVDQLSAFASEVTRVAKEVGTEGQLGGQARVEGVAGVWRDLTDNVNQLAGNLTVQLRDVSAVATAIADGDLTRKITVEAQGEILQIKDVINSMVDRLSVFADEVTRVAREVGTEGKLGGQAEVPGAAGTWRQLTVEAKGEIAALADTINGMIETLATFVTWSAKVASVRIIELIVSASVAISPLASTTNFCERSPMATAVTTFAMPRTWLVRFEAM